MNCGRLIRTAAEQVAQFVLVVDPRRLHQLQMGNFVDVAFLNHRNTRPNVALKSCVSVVKFK